MCLKNLMVNKITGINNENKIQIANLSKFRTVLKSKSDKLHVK